MSGIWKNKETEEVVYAVRIGYDGSRPYWFRKLEELKKIKPNYAKRKLKIFNKTYMIDNAPYMYRYKNKIVLKEGIIFYAEFEHLENATYDERLFEEADKKLIEILQNYGEINNYFEVVEIRV